MFDYKINNIWVDIDGVAANFDKLADKILGTSNKEFETRYGSDIFWKKLGEYPNFFLNLEVMSDFDYLYRILSYTYNSPFLTGAPSQLGEQARVDKVRWVERNFSKEQRVVVCQSKVKHMYCVSGDILIDDTLRHETKWKEAGGLFIHHINAKKTINELIRLNMLEEDIL